MKLFELAATLSLDTKGFSGNVNKAMADGQKLADTLSQRTNPEVEDLGDKMGDASDQSNSLSKGLKKTTEAGSRFEKVLRTIGKVLTAKFIVGTIADIGKVLFATAEQSREYRTEMSKLATAFEINNLPANTAKQTYEGLYAVLGDVDRAVETAGHIAAMSQQYEDLTNWITICTGVFATFGDSLPVEGLAEAANETAKTGEVVGLLADALNWAGVKEDEFNAKLESANGERERSEMIMETLVALYGEAASAFEKNNAAVLESNRAQEELRSALAEVGAAMEPLATKVTQLGTRLVTWVTPAIQWMANGLVWVADNAGAAWEAVKNFFGVTIPSGWNSMISGITSAWNSVVSEIQSAIDKIKEFFGLSSRGISGGSDLFSDHPAYKGGVNQAAGYGLGADGGSGASAVAFDTDIGLLDKLRGFAVGLDYVPSNNFIARLHEGEAVLTKSEATDWRRGEGQGVSLDLSGLAEALGEIINDRPIAINIDSKAFATIMAREMSRSIGNRNIQTLMGMGG